MILKTADQVFQVGNTDGVDMHSPSIYMGTRVCAGGYPASSALGSGGNQS